MEEYNTIMTSTKSMLSLVTEDRDLTEEYGTIFRDVVYYDIIRKSLSVVLTRKP